MVNQEKAANPREAVFKPERTTRNFSPSLLLPLDDLDKIYLHMLMVFYISGIICV